MNKPCQTFKIGAAILLLMLTIHSGARDVEANEPPVAEAGLSRYAASEYIQLDGTRSYDPDRSGPLTYSWTQVSGPSVTIINDDTAMLTVGGFMQTDEIQECLFRLVVSDGELTSRPDTVKVIIVRDFGVDKLIHLNPPFDPNKPTWIMFGGLGGCQNVGSDPSWFVGYPESVVGWSVIDKECNFITFQQIQPYFYSYSPEEKIGDMLMVYLSEHAPDYKQPIQTDGASAGGQPAIDIAIYVNETYADTRYAVNRVTLFDAAGYCRDYADWAACIDRFLASAVDDEQCWIDNYPSTLPGSWGGMKRDYGFQPNVLTVWFDAINGLLDQYAAHELPGEFYGNTLVDPELSNFNHGVVAGSYWSVIGPGKNLQLASTPGAETYKFTWYGNASVGHMDFYDEPNHPGRLPEPVTLVGPLETDGEAIVLTCEESENAVGYELLFGPDPYRIVDYSLVSNGPTPPTEPVTELPYEQTWWTVKVRDRYGSTIHADPQRLDASGVSLPVNSMLVTNTTINREYTSIQAAIDEAMDGDEIVVNPARYPYWGPLDFLGKNIVLRSTEPDNAAVVASAIIDARGRGSAVTFAGGEGQDCLLAGFTLTGGDAELGGGVACVGGSSPTIKHCAVTTNVANRAGGGVYITGGNPTLSNCILSSNQATFMGGGIACEDGGFTLENCTFHGNASVLGAAVSAPGSTAGMTNCIVYGNAGIPLFGITDVTHCNVEGGFPGEGNIDADPLFADPGNGDYHLKSEAGRWDHTAQAWVTDDATSPCIDTGHPESSVMDEPEPNGGQVNMGAYGGTSEASKSP